MRSSKPPALSFKFVPLNLQPLLLFVCLQQLTFEEVYLIGVPIVKGACYWINQVRSQSGELVADWTCACDSFIEGRVAYRDQVILLRDVITHISYSFLQLYLISMKSILTDMIYSSL